MKNAIIILNIFAVSILITAIATIAIIKIINFIRASEDRHSMMDFVIGWASRKIMNTPIKIKILDGGRMPELKHDGDAGYDCYARIDEPVTIEPGEVKIIPLGFCLELPTNWYADVRPRSGLAAKNHIVAQLGLIDEPYRNELGGIISNLSKIPFTVNKGDRICQLMCHEVEHYEFMKVDSLSTTDRGEGFGSSGI